MIPKTLRKKLYHIVDVIHNNEISFLQKFIGPGFSDLISVSISSEKVKFVALSNDGQHVGYDCSIDDYNEWFFSLPPEERINFYHKVKGKENASIEK